MKLTSLAHVKAVAKKLPLDSELREIILCEPDVIPESEFETKSKVWLQLLELELLKEKSLKVGSPAENCPASAAIETREQDANHKWK